MQKPFRAPVQTGFTLIELMVVVAIILVLASLLLGAVSLAIKQGHKASCINNNRNLIQAWQLYAHDNQDTVVSLGSGIWYPPGTLGWIGAPEGAGSSGPDSQRPGYNLPGSFYWNSSYYTDRNVSAFAQYIENPKVYKCPADRTNFRMKMFGRERLIPSTLSYGMNVFMEGSRKRFWEDADTFEKVGYGNPELSRGLLIDYFSWKRYRKTSDIGKPSKIFVFMEHAPGSPSLGGFLTWMPTAGGRLQEAADSEVLFDVPSSVHGEGATVPFADGHVEVHKWLDPRTKVDLLMSDGTPGPVYEGSPGNSRNISRRVPAAGSPDLAWLRDHATEPQYYEGPPF